MYLERIYFRPEEKKRKEKKEKEERTKVDIYDENYEGIVFQDRWSLYRNRDENR